MERYFKKRTLEESNVQESQASINKQVSSSSLPNVEINVDDLQADPGLRKSIYTYDANDRERVRRSYLQKGPCQPRDHSFPWTNFGTEQRRFIPTWFNDYSSWLEYSKTKDAAYCLCCYLFKPQHGNQGGGDTFVGEGFRDWKRKKRLTEHVGKHNSIHNQCLRACEDLMKPSQHIEVCFSTQSDQARVDYRTRLTASVDCIRFLLRQGLAFRGHDESEESINQGNFLALLHFVADHNEDIKKVHVIEGICSGKIITGRGLNQEATLKRAGDTRWSSHYTTILSVILLFSSVIDVLEVVEKDGTLSEQRAEASDLLDAIQSFEFAFQLHLMKTVLGMSNELSQALQKKDQDIVNAMSLVKVSKERLQKLRDKGWESLVNEVSLFCDKYEIIIPNMDDLFVVRGRSCRNAQETTHLHHYRVELFYTVVDMQLQELNNRFNEVSTELLLCMASLDPSATFSSFDKRKLLRFAEFYPSDFSSLQLMMLDNQLETYFLDVSSNDQFSDVKGISGLAQKLVETKKDVIYPLVYLLVKLALILPVATASVERAFSAMNIIKTSLRNRMGDEWMNDCLVTYIERDIFDTINNEVIL
ncbi:uncharacterized protein LOC130759880 [Actinidia eriantha]|uniref:uncharacterized protein LOC130759880 n=1 Tax=Actinidia eriantha TaxID=165200 RepID=UPI00258A922B|nr:uncharacterized protein LOC130759880 [Actinidia eriantha]